MVFCRSFFFFPKSLFFGGFWDSCFISGQASFFEFGILLLGF